MVRQYLTIDGRRLSYLERRAPGARRALVFLHAFPFDADMWAPQFDAIPASWRLIAPDFRGFGHSDADGGDLASAGLALEDYARDVQDSEGIAGRHQRRALQDNGPA